MKPKRKKRKPPAKPDRKTGLGRFRVWWLSLPNSFRALPNLPPTRRPEVEYNAFLEEVRKGWAAEGENVLRELIQRSPDLELRTLQQSYLLIKHAFAAMRGLLREDFPKLAGSLEPRLAVLLDRGATLHGAVITWAREVRRYYAMIRWVPLLSPPLGFFGCDPKRQDIVLGVPVFGFWASGKFASTFPWRDPGNFTLCGKKAEPGSVLPFAPDTFQALSTAIEQKWRERMGSGPEGWNDLLLESSRSPVWVAWALFRLLRSWVTPIADVRDTAFVEAYLMQVHKDYREWLRDYFDPAVAQAAGDAAFADVFPPAGISHKAPRDLVSDQGVPDYASLHRAACFVWYACDRIAECGMPSRSVRTWKSRAWVDPALQYIFANPGCRLADVAAHVGKDPSTLYRHPQISAALKVGKNELPKGEKGKDGSLEAVADESEE